MKLTEEKVKQIIAKVHRDLKLDCDDRFPIKVNFFKNDDIYTKDYWAGIYDYSKPPEGVKIGRTYPCDFVNIDDEKEIAFSVSFFPYDSPIELDKNGNYVWRRE